MIKFTFLYEPRATPPSWDTSKCTSKRIVVLLTWSHLWQAAWRNCSIVIGSATSETGACDRPGPNTKPRNATPSQRPVPLTPSRRLP